MKLKDISDHTKIIWLLIIIMVLILFLPMVCWNGNCPNDALTIGSSDSVYEGAFYYCVSLLQESVYTNTYMYANFTNQTFNETLTTQYILDSNISEQILEVVRE